MHVTRRPRQRNNVIVSTTFPCLVAEYCPRDIFTIYIIQLGFRRSPVAGESIEKALKEILSTIVMLPGKCNQWWLQLASGIAWAIFSRIQLFQCM